MYVRTLKLTATHYYNCKYFTKNYPFCQWRFIKNNKKFRKKTRFYANLIFLKPKAKKDNRHKPYF